MTCGYNFPSAIEEKEAFPSTCPRAYSQHNNLSKVKEEAPLIIDPGAQCSTGNHPEDPWLLLLRFSWKH